MPLFKYKIIDSLGNNQKGSLEAINEEEAIQTLQNKSYFILKIQSNKKKNSSFLKILRKFDLFQPRVSKKKIIDFTRQFSSLLLTGIPYHRALKVIINSEKNKFFRGILSQIHYKVVEGGSLADCLKQFPNIFTPMYISLVQAGEVGGNLGDLMQKQAEFDYNQFKIDNRVRSALIYPMIMSFVALGIIIFMIKFILPKIIPIFDHFDTVLPFPTRIVIFLSDLISNYGWQVFVSFLIFLFGLNFWLKSQKGKSQFDYFLLKIPAYNQFLRKILNYRFIQVLSTLLSSGVNLKKSLEICKDITGNSYYENRIYQLNILVTQQGMSLSQGLQKNKLLNDALIQTVKVGEENTNLPATLKQAAKNMEIELESALSRYVSLLEPFIILLMAFFVGFIILSVLLPMFQLNQLV